VWIEPLAKLLSGHDEKLVDDAIAVVRAVPPTQDRAALVSEALLTLARDEKAPTARRLAALAAMPAGAESVDPKLFELLLSHLGADQDFAARAAAVDALVRAKLSREQLSAVAAALPNASPLDVERLLATFDQTTEAELGLAVIEGLKKSPALPGLHVDVLKPRLARFGPTVEKKAEELYALINVGATQQRAQLDSLLASLPAGDVRRGQAIFQSAKAACNTCHAIGYLGGKLGPDLTRIGSIRNQRDLVESIALPSASFVRSYESWTVATSEGKVYSGLLTKNSPEEVVLALDAREQVTIPRGDIEEIKPGTVSVMPAGLDKQLTPQELADLVAFLQAAK
jgi:putative heme-binding domain-containing protein